jgi:hypothetical protein
VREALEKEWEDGEDSSQDEDEGGGRCEISFKHFLECVKYCKTINREEMALQCAWCPYFQNIIFVNVTKPRLFFVHCRQYRTGY